MSPQFRAFVVPLYNGRYLEVNGRWEYRHAANVDQAGALFRAIFPWPKFKVDQVGAWETKSREVAMSIETYEERWNQMSLPERKRIDSSPWTVEKSWHELPQSTRKSITAVFEGAYPPLFGPLIDTRPASIKRQEIDWHRDSKDLSVALQEQVVSLCSEGLLKTRDWLKAQIMDEHTAQNDYLRTSVHLTALELPTWASALKSMAGDEGRHRAILEVIVDVITEKCGATHSEPPEGSEWYPPGTHDFWRNKTTGKVVHPTMVRES